MKGHPAPVMERILERTEIVEGPLDSPCWVSTGYRMPNGYATVGHGELVHRVAYTEMIGPIPEGLTLDHLCRNRACWNPDHLEPVTNRENILRGTAWSAVNARKTHCPQDHEFTPENTIYWNGQRKCRECNNARQRRRWHERKVDA